MDAEARVYLEEKRAARDSWRRNGGSARRPLKSFATADEKRARRLEHAERIREAVARLQSPDGFADWLQSLELNPDVSALNAALIALQCPGEIAGTAAFWKRNGYMIRKGARAAGYITGPNFYPRAIFSAEDAGADDLAGMIPEGVTDVDETALEMLRSRLAEGMKGRDVCELIAGRLGLREATA
jgi:hypothetical protein